MDNKQKVKFILNFAKSKNKIFNVITIIVLIATIFLTIATIYLTNINQPEPVYAISTDEENKFVDFDIHYLTDCIATYTYDGNVDKFYFAKDEDYIVIVKLSDDQINNMKDIIDYTYGEIDEKPEPMIITGTYKKIPIELKNIALESYNDMFEEYKITNDEFENYLGSCYIDTSITPYTNTISSLSIFAIFGYIYLLIALIVKLIWYLKSKSNINKIVKNNELDDLYFELNNELSITKLDEQDIVLTQNYLIDYYNFLQILKYKDIVWMYQYSYKYNGVETRCIKILDKNRKIRCIGYKNSTKRNYELINNLFNLLQQKNPNALVGYSKENIQATNKSNFKDTVDKIDTNLFN